MVAGTSAPPGVRSVSAMVDCWTASSKVALTVLPTATPVAPARGLRAVTVGAVVSGVSVVNDHDTGSMVLPAASRAPLTVTV